TCSRLPANADRPSPRAAQESAPLLFPHQAAAASPRALQSRPEPQESRFSLRCSESHSIKTDELFLHHPRVESMSFSSIWRTSNPRIASPSSSCASITALSFSTLVLGFSLAFA